MKIKYKNYLDKSERQFLFRFDAYLDGKNIGYLTCHKSKDGNYILIKGIYVKKKYRNKGIGTKLLQRALKKYNGKEIRLRARPYKQFSLTTRQLIKFYEKFGFKIYDTQGRMIKTKF